MDQDSLQLAEAYVSPSVFLILVMCLLMLLNQSAGS